MLELLKTLKDTPLPIVLVIGGLIFLLIPFIRKIQAKEAVVETANQLGAGMIGFTLLAIGIGLYIVPSGTAASPPSTNIPPTTIVQPSVIPPTSLVQPTNTAALSRCELIKRDFPQSAEGIASKFGIPVNSIFDVNRENCGDSIIDGFIYRSNQEVELTVPDGGCIDAPPDAYFSDGTSSNGVGGSRAFSGIVRASAITYRVWCYK